MISRETSYYVKLFLWCGISYYITTTELFRENYVIVKVLALAFMALYPCIKFYQFWKWRSMKQIALDYRPPYLKQSTRRTDVAIPTPTWLLKDRKVLVVVNPYGGSKNGNYIFEDLIRPMFSNSNIPFDSIITTHATHAYEIGKTINRDIYCAVVIISGDGTVSNVLQGISSQCKADVATLRDFFKEFVIGIIPGGTSNGLALSLDFTEPLKAIRKLIEGNSQFIDAMQLWPKNKEIVMEPRWDLHTFNWGFAAEVDYLLEKQLRWMPKTIREIYAPVYLMMKNKIYKQKRFSIKPAPVSQQDVKEKYYQDPANMKDDNINKGWKLIEGDISFLNVANTSIAAEGVMFSPHKKLNEGAVDVCITRNMTRLKSMIMFLFEAPTGKQISSDHFWVYKVTELEFIPHDLIHMDSSGESIDWGNDGVCLKVYGDIVRMIM